jgi:pimeloyl-ACP methyl ester carboxylesterase
MAPPPDPIQGKGRMRIPFLLAAWLVLPSATVLSQTIANPARTITVGKLTLTRCIHEYDGYCGSITQPLDSTGNLPGNVTVGFEFYPHTDTSQPALGVILAQEGGPGYSTTGSRDGYVRMLDPLRDRRDILLVDKRGTGRSSAIDCPALQQAYLPTRRDIGQCGRQLGKSAWFYRSADAANDVAAVVTALELSPVDFYGDSYGTWFGQVLAVMHPGLLRSAVFDSAYPVLGDNANSEVNAGQRAMDIACERSQPCRALGGSATARFATLLTAVRQNPPTGTARGAEGEPRDVTADPRGLFLVIANAGNTPDTWRDLDAAGRAWLDHHDALPLLRLVAEARDSYSGGGGYRSFSVGLATAVQCAEYGNIFNLKAPRATRRQQYQAALDRLRTNHPQAYAPFTIDDAVYSQMNAEEYDSCLTWPKPPAYVTQAQPIPPNAVFPDLPLLVLSGELDTVTSPSEGRATTALFPNASFIETPNTIHEGAIGDGGVFVPPNGQDLAECIGPIVRHFIASGGATGDTSCLRSIRPIRTVPDFARDYTGLAPAMAEPGNATDETGLKLASAVAETIGDAVARYYVTISGHGAGLRGGSFNVATTIHGYSITLTHAVWADGVSVTGPIIWDQQRGAIIADVTFVASGHSGSVHVDWNDRQTEAMAQIRGTIDGDRLVASRLAP